MLLVRGGWWRIVAEVSDACQMLPIKLKGISGKCSLASKSFLTAWFSILNPSIVYTVLE
jgi:hypothetical protein